jgi:hypothetical protein
VRRGAQVDGGVVEAEAFGFGPEVEGISGSAALEAVEEVVVEVDGEATARARRRTVQGARAALLCAARALRLKAKQLEDGGDRDGSANGGEVDGGQCRGPERRATLVVGLTEQFAAFAGLGQFAVTLAEDLLGASLELVSGSDVADGAVQSDVVVQLNNAMPAIPQLVKWSIHGTRGLASKYSANLPRRLKRSFAVRPQAMRASGSWRSRSGCLIASAVA